MKSGETRLSLFGRFNPHPALFGEEFLVPPCVLSWLTLTEAATVLVTRLEGTEAYGLTLMYSRTDREGNWYRWPLERPKAERRWQRTDPPFTGTDSAMGTQRVLAGRADDLDEKERAEAEKGIPFNRELTLNAGRYRGFTLGYVLDNDPSYAEWCVRNMDAIKGRCLLPQAMENTTR